MAFSSDEKKGFLFRSSILFKEIEEQGLPLATEFFKNVAETYGL